MGQRTVIIVKKTDRYGKQTLRLVHHQWGFGKVMPSMLMKEFLACEYNNNKNKYTNKLKDFFNFTNNKNNLYSTKGLKASDDIFSKEFLQKVYNRIDNNNGSCIIEIVEEPNEKLADGTIYDRGYVRLQSVKISFVLGSEECDFNYELNKYIGEEPFTRLVSAKEYMEKTGGEMYCPAQFVNMFTQFCSFWGIEQVVDEVV